jgi:endonuclease/exonuclease/phosphatase family metal-dependent hydrolase
MITTQPAVETLADGGAPGIEVGSFIPDGSQAAACSRLVIATYNIRYAAGSFLITGSLLRRARLGRPGRRPALVARNLALAAQLLADGERMPAADIIALQEADRGTIRAGSHHVARELARHLDMRYAFAGAQHPPHEEQKKKQWYLDFEERLAPRDTGKTGVAILSRLRPVALRRVDLPWKECAWRPRLAIAASFQIADRRLHVFNAHIDPHASVSEQLDQHAAIIDAARHMAGDDPVVLLGDFNTLSNQAGVEMRRYLESHGYTTPLPTGTPTWRAGPIRLHTDWIFTRHLPVESWGVARRPGISDHWPVWVKIGPWFNAQGS